MNQLYAIQIGNDESRPIYVAQRMTKGNWHSYGLYCAYRGTKEQCEQHLAKFLKKYPSSDPAQASIVPLSPEDNERFLKFAKDDADYKRYKDHTCSIQVFLSDDGQSVIIQAGNKRLNSAGKAAFELLKNLGVSVRVGTKGRTFVNTYIKRGGK